MGKLAHELAHHAAHEAMKGAGCMVTFLTVLTGFGTFSAIVALVLFS